MSDLDVLWMPLFFLGVPLLIGWVFALRQSVRVWRRAEASGEPRRWQRARASLAFVLVVVAGFLMLAIGPLWFRATFPRTLLLDTELWLLAVGWIVYGAAVLIAALAIIPLLAALIRTRKLPLARSRAARCLVLAVSLLVAAGVAEGVAAACLWANSVPMPWLPIRFADRPDDQVVDILVIGESMPRACHTTGGFPSPTS